MTKTERETMAEMQQAIDNYRDENEKLMVQHVEDLNLTMALETELHDYKDVYSSTQKKLNTINDALCSIISGFASTLNKLTSLYDDI